MAKEDKDRFKFDKSSKWLIQHHADAVLRLGGAGEAESWRALAPELVQPRQIPDALVEAKLKGRAQKDLFLIEVYTYPDNRIAGEMLDGMLLTYLDRRVLPEVLALVLHPKGNLRAGPGLDLVSPLGLSRLTGGWRVVELWTLPAAPLLAAEDPGLVPWIPLMDFDGPPESLMRQCRDIIDRKAKPEEVKNLLAVSGVLAGLRYNDETLLSIFGGKQAMLESPVLQELIAEERADERHSAIVSFLKGRFGNVPEGIVLAIRAVNDRQRLDMLSELAGRCPDLGAFAAAVNATE